MFDSQLARKFIADGVFKAELNELFSRVLRDDGYTGMEIRTTPAKTEIIIKAVQTQNICGEKGSRLRELTALVQKRFQFPVDGLVIFAERVEARGLSSIAQAESLKAKLLMGLPVRRAANSIIRFVMRSGARGVQVIVAGKVRGQRARALKFVDGVMIHSGQPARDFVDVAVRHVLLKQGVLGVTVKINHVYDPSGKLGPRHPLPDSIVVLEPKEEDQQYE